MSMPDPDLEASERTGRVLYEIARERARQTAKHGDQSHLPDGTGPNVLLSGIPMWDDSTRAGFLANWAKARCKAASQNEGGNGTITYEHILTEEWAEAIAESDPAKLRAELLQVAAVAVQWIETLDRRTLRDCTHGADCPVHPNANGLHNLDPIDDRLMP